MPEKNSPSTGIFMSNDARVGGREGGGGGGTERGREGRGRRRNGGRNRKRL